MNAQTITKKELNWTKIGKEDFADDQDKIIACIERMEWIDIIETMYLSKSDIITLPFAQGEGIKSAIKEFKIPKVSHISYQNCFSNGSGTYGLYGIFGHYKNADVKLYFVDSGDCLTPVCTEVFNK